MKRARVNHPTLLVRTAPGVVQRCSMRLVLLVCAALAGVARAQEDFESLTARAGELHRKGDAAAATKLVEQIVKIADRQFGKEAAESVEWANNLALLYDAQGQFALAEPLFERVAAHREKSLGPDHPETATALNDLASVYNAQGRYDEAERLFNRAIAIYEKSSGADHPHTAMSLGNLAGLHKLRGQYERAEPLYRRALQILEKALGPDHLNTAIALNNLASIHDVQGQYAEAERLYMQSLAIARKTLGDEHPDTATRLNNLAAVYMKQGEYVRAEPLLTRAIEIKERTLGPEHPDLAHSLNNLACVYNAQGQHARAEPLFKRALALVERQLGPDHQHVAVILNSLAELHRVQGQHELAVPLYKRSLAILEKSLGPNHPNMATSLNNLALSYAAQGEYGLAESLSEKSLAIMERVLGPDHPDTAASASNLALLFDIQGKDTLAEPLFRRALATSERSFGCDHPRTAAILLNLSGLEAARGRLAEASGLADRSRRSTRRYVARTLPALSAIEQTAFLRTLDERDFHGCLSMCLLHEAGPSTAALAAGWLANGKAVAQEASSQRVILARQSGNPVTKAAVASLERVRANLARLAQTTPAPAEAAAYQAKLAELQEEEQRLVHEIGGQIAALARDEPWVELDAIRRNIPAGAMLVDIARFGVFDLTAKGEASAWQPPRYAAWIVPPAGAGDVTILDLGPADEIDAAVQAYREAIEAVQKGGFARGQATAEEDLMITAAPLATKVLQPIIAALGDATEVILSPDGSLWLVPWQALPLADGSYAIEQYAIRTVTSARDLVPVPVKAAGGKGGPVVVADPAFDAAPPASGKPASDATRALAPASKATWRFSPLPGTRAEALATKPAIAKVSGGEPKVLLGRDASETKLKQAAVRPASLVLATHGFFKPDQAVKQDDRQGLGSAAGGRGSAPVLTTSGEPLEDPLLRCGLALAGANAATQSGADDGILTGTEIVGLDLLGTDLVVLSACETGVGRVHNGEGVAGLRQAFQIAGAKTVVATLWQIPDAESSQIMQAFYANLTQGDPAAKALREAQLAFIKARREDRNYEAAHPYLWAAYGVTGR